jgi:hypothetical protein
MKKDISEILDVNTVNIVIGILYSHFGELLDDRDPNLVQWIVLLEDYCLSKGAQYDIMLDGIKRQENPKNSFGKNRRGDLNQRTK